MLGIPYGGMGITGGAATQALTSTFAKLAQWSAAGGFAYPDSGSGDGDPAVEVDLANNRLLANAGGGGGPAQRFAVSALLTVSAGGAADVTAQVYKNAVAQAGLVGKGTVASSGKVQIAIQGILTVNPGDAPGTVATMAAPAGTFTGASGAPKTMCPVEIFMKSSAGVTLTFEECAFTIERLA